MLLHLILVFLYLSLVNSTLEKKFHVKCLSETKVSLREVREANYGDVDNLSDALLYYIKCVEVKENYLDSNGKIVSNRYKEKLDAETEKTTFCLKNLPQIYDSKEIRMFLKCFNE